MTRLDQQIAFLMEADKLKQVTRANTLLDQSRQENTAEHSWHVAIWAVLHGHDIDPAADIGRVIAMLLIHDLVEIEVGDHPIHLVTDWDAVAKAEDAAAERIFRLLPEDQAGVFLGLWREFEAAETPDARLAKIIDTTQPIFQVLRAEPWDPSHVAIVRENLSTGRARNLARRWPEAAETAKALLAGQPTPDNRLARTLDFLSDIDRLKSVDRATLISGGARRENSAEHSWHLALMALVLATDAKVSAAEVVRMMLVHDIVEVDAGDNPIFASYDPADMAMQELAAADRLFGLLPAPLNADLRAVWDRFEANATAEARFAKSLDRFQPPLMNLNTGGGSWVEYNVTFDMVAERVGAKIASGAPWLWAWIEPQVEGFFRERASRT
ncbi:HD domain-containing protein [Shimia ponticola]|uniref:HD domain-containing protein n=1 Tax=Shimia ponticola TaxID=2582893 RepID=UPI002107CA1B|nr:HD domain-containing protein [Shimia ponticola]